jgi:ABC-type glycerol-3-phosphate transport system substrate-binding protein
VAISEHSENKDAAWEFVKKFLSDEFQNSNPIIFSIKKSAFTYENYSEYNDFISSLSQVYVSDVEILDIIEEEYYYLETGESTATQVARQVQKRVIKYLEQLSK